MEITSHLNENFGQTDTWSAELSQEEDTLEVVPSAPPPQLHTHPLLFYTALYVMNDTILNKKNITHFNNQI